MQLENTLFDYSPITERPEFSWPGGKKVAFYVGLNIEHFRIDKPSTSIWPGTADLVPDALNYGWRDYGARVGVWRVMDALDKYGIRASALLNSDVVEYNPQIVKAGMERDWAWLVHGKTNSEVTAGMSPEEERDYLTRVVDVIAGATGARPKGWMGPGLTETFETPRILRDLGLDYILDWTNDDQPYALNVPGMLSVPYTLELNDLGIFAKATTGPEYVRMIQDQYDVLLSESDRSARVLPIALHPFVIGQAFRTKYLEQALGFLAAQPDVWLTTADEIAAYFRDTVLGQH
ncbi:MULTISPECIES: polysaccharide deacetylase family protein [unclassified Nocardia]|uniref:polysaccharide deacetylase family protein n=1 Tax=unclassified Nocardia TaxID=2637762 RepID=UPI0024A8A8B0|nr:MULTISPECIES: polysaccharide deacetylase family protein [unclassified Nocardia]